MYTKHALNLSAAPAPPVIAPTKKAALAAASSFFMTFSLLKRAKNDGNPRVAVSKVCAKRPVETSPNCLTIRHKGLSETRRRVDAQEGAIARDDHEYDDGRHVW